MRVESLYTVELEIKGSDGQTHKIVCDKWKGASVKAKTKKYRPANGLAPSIVLPGPRSVEAVTLTRLYDESINQIESWLLNQAGRASIRATKQPLDENGNPFGQARSFTGKLDMVTPPDTDSESDKEAVIEFACTLEDNFA